MIQPEFDPKRIRKCEIVVIDGQNMIQFVATGDRHKMMKKDDGSIEIVKLFEQGNDYSYGSPYTIEEALAILDGDHYQTHRVIANKIRAHIQS